MRDPCATRLTLAYCIRRLPSDYSGRTSGLWDGEDNPQGLPDATRRQRSGSEGHTVYGLEPMTPKGPPFAIRRVPVGDVKENPDNPRSISVDQFKRLVASVREFPQMLDIRPLVVDADMVVLGGNMRLKACREAGLTAVPVVIADTLTPDQRREFIIKDNASFGAWDWDVLANEWGDEPLPDWGVDVPSFDLDAIAEEEPTSFVSVPDTPIEIGVFVVCTAEKEQRSLYERLMKEGWTCKLIA